MMIPAAQPGVTRFGNEEKGYLDFHIDFDGDVVIEDPSEGMAMNFIPSDDLDNVIEYLVKIQEIRAS